MLSAPACGDKSSPAAMAAAAQTRVAVEAVIPALIRSPVTDNSGFVIAAGPWRPQGAVNKTRSIAREAREQQVVLPQPVDAEILPRIAFARKARVFQEPDRGRVGGNAGRLEPVQAQRSERERH